MNKKSFFLSLSLVSVLLGCSSTKPVETSNKKMTPHEMIQNYRFAEAKNEFAMPNDINAVDSKGNTVLHYAAEKGVEDLITYFIFVGADPNKKNNDGDTPLHLAIWNNAFDAAQQLVALCPEALFDRDGGNNTAIDLALTMEKSLEYDPDYMADEENKANYLDRFITTKVGKVRDTEGQTIVHYFVKTKNLEGISKCAEKGIPLSVKDNNGKTPLDLAFENCNDDDSIAIAVKLIQSGAEEVDTDFSYFQDAALARNVNERFDDGQTPLHLAAIMGHAGIARYLLNSDSLFHEKADTSVQDSSGATPLHEAVRYGNYDIAAALLASGANVNAMDNLGKTPIMLIMPREWLSTMYKLLISYRADLTMKDMYGDTVLHTAAMMNLDTDVISILTNAGADVNARNKEGVTPLEIAVQKNDIQNVRLLTKCGANIHTQDTNGNSPLSMAFASTSEMLEAVVNANNSTSQDSDGNTPLHIALLTDAPLSKIQYIISLTSDVNIRNRDGNSALFLAVLKNRQKVGEMLLAKNADIFSTNTNNNSPLRLALKYGGTVQDWIITSKTIKSKDGSGNSVLHYAAEWQYGDAITSLLSKGASISAKNANGETPLFSAVKTNNPRIIKLIVDGGADVVARDNLGSTAMHTAIRWDAPLSVDCLVDMGLSVNVQNSAGKSPLAEAVVASKFELAKKLLSYGADPNCSDTNGVTILMDAIRGCNKDNVQLLLNYGANPNVQEINGRNAYHEAAFMGDIDIIRLIRNAGGNPLARDKQSKTPFSIVINKDIDIISEILGDSYNITDSDGNTPVHIVVKSKASNELLQTLINEGYPLDTRNADGYTALNYAIEANNVKTAEILLSNGANPFQLIDKKGKNGVTMALDKNNKNMIANIVKYAGDMTDVQGNTILHYAAKNANEETVKTLIAYATDKTVKNVSGDTPYDIAVRWGRPKVICELLK